MLSQGPVRILSITLILLRPSPSRRIFFAGTVIMMRRVSFLPILLINVYKTLLISLDKVNTKKL
jgi:hypothetical protein